MDTRLIETTDPNGWEAALTGIPHGIAHTHGFVTCLARSTGTNAHLFVAESYDGRAVCPIAERSYKGSVDVYSPYGFGGFAGSGDLAGLHSAWSQFTRKRGYVTSYLMQHPVLTPKEIMRLWHDDSATDRRAYVVDLQCSAEERWRHVSKRKRASLQQWVQTAQLETNQITLAEAFIALYPTFAKRREMASLYNFSKATLRELVSLPETFLVGVQDVDGEVSCVALMSTTKECGDYLFMASTVHGDANGSGVLWLGLQELAAQDVKACNLGGGIREGDGVAEMKRRLGGIAHALPVFQEIHDHTRYRTLCATAGRSSEEKVFFPPYHAP